jgi:hypothetical protein
MLICNNKILLILYVLHYTSCIKSECAKHFPLFIGCEKYLFDCTKSDDSTDFADNISFSQYIYILGWVVNEQLCRQYISNH